MNEKIIDLQYPIPIKLEDGSKGTTNQIKLGRMKLKHLKNLPKSLFNKKGKTLDSNELVPILAGLTGLPEDTIEEIDMADLEHIGAELESFLSSSLESGKNSSGV